jgi:hypothetical protein
MTATICQSSVGRGKGETGRVEVRVESDDGGSTRARRRDILSACAGRRVVALQARCAGGVQVRAQTRPEDIHACWELGHKMGAMQGGGAHLWKRA